MIDARRVVTPFDDPSDLPDDPLFDEAPMPGDDDEPGNVRSIGTAKRGAKQKASGKQKAPQTPPNDLVQMTGNGRIVSSAGNAATLLRHDERWAGVLEYDERTGEIKLASTPPFPADLADPRDTFPRPVVDADLTRIAVDLARTYDATLGAESISAALDVVARERPRDPVREYLDAQVWDGVPRLDTWLPDLLGAADTNYSRSIGPKWMISGVARTYEPGVQCDHVLTLESAKQGVGKSTALRTLAVSDEWFTDQLGDMRDKDAADSLRGPWLVEIAELDAMQRSEVATVKAFVSRRTDRFRPAYAKRTVNFARRCFFAASTNESSYLRDPTGARRFWPVRCGTINVPAILGQRDQLWAEAVARYRAGEAWHPDAELALDAAAAQEERYQGDAWEGDISAYLDTRDDATVREVAVEALGIDLQHLDQRAQNRIVQALTRLRWTSTGNPVSRVINGRKGRARVYTAPREAGES